MIEKTIKQLLSHEKKVESKKNGQKLKKILLDQFDKMNEEDFNNKFDQFKHNKLFMSQLIKGYAQINNEFSYKVLEYAIDNYVPDYFAFFNNLFVDSKFEISIRK